MVQRSRRILLTASPCDKGIRTDVESHVPIAFLEKGTDPHLELPSASAIASSTIPFFQIGQVILQMFSKRPRCRIPNDFRFENARSLLFLFPKEFLGSLFGNLFVGHAKRSPTIHRHFSHPIAQVIAPRETKNPVLTKPALFDFENQLFLLSIIPSTSLFLKRTPPRILTRFKFPS